MRSTAPRAPGAPPRGCHALWRGNPHVPGRVRGSLPSTAPHIARHPRRRAARSFLGKCRGRRALAARHTRSRSRPASSQQGPGVTGSRAPGGHRPCLCRPGTLLQLRAGRGAGGEDFPPGADTRGSRGRAGTSAGPHPAPMDPCHEAGRWRSAVSCKWRPSPAGTAGRQEPIPRRRAERQAQAANSGGPDGRRARAGPDGPGGHQPAGRCRTGAGRGSWARRPGGHRQGPHPAPESPCRQAQPGPPAESRK